MIAGCDREWKKPKSLQELITKLNEGCRFLYDSSTNACFAKEWRIYRKQIKREGINVMFVEWVAIVKKDDKRPPMFEFNGQELISLPDAKNRLKHNWGLYYYDESC